MLPRCRAHPEFENEQPHAAGYPAYANGNQRCAVSSAGDPPRFPPAILRDSQQGSHAPAPNLLRILSGCCKPTSSLSHLESVSSESARIRGKCDTTPRPRAGASFLPVLFRHSEPLLAVTLLRPMFGEWTDSGDQRVGLPRRCSGEGSTLVPSAVRHRYTRNSPADVRPDRRLSRNRSARPAECLWCRSRVHKFRESNRQFLDTRAAELRTAT